MKPQILLPMVASLLFTGCTHEQLRRSTIKTSATLTELQYKQVLDNLAMFAENPGSLPFFATALTGTVQVADSAAVNGTLDFVPHKLTAGNLGLGPASRQLTETWNLTSALAPNKLLKMKNLYDYVIYGTTDECLDQTGTVKGDYCGVPRGFFKCGGKHDVPKDACYVGQHGSTFVWVSAEGVEDLTRLTLQVLNIATADDSASARAVAGTYGTAAGALPTLFDETPRLTPVAPPGLQYVPTAPR